VCGTWICCQCTCCCRIEKVDDDIKMTQTDTERRLTARMLCWALSVVAIIVVTVMGSYIAACHYERDCLWAPPADVRSVQCSDNITATCYNIHALYVYPPDATNSIPHYFEQYPWPDPPSTDPCMVNECYGKKNYRIESTREEVKDWTSTQVWYISMGCLVAFAVFSLIGNHCEHGPCREGAPINYQLSG
jgi:hypothetical protein